MPKAFSEAERARIRERLIAAGKKSINRAGTRFLVVDDIAREAGISKGSFYSFFPSREDFILSVFESWEAEYRNKLLAEIMDGSGTPRERLERFFLGLFAVFEREPGLARISYGEIERLIEVLPPARMAAHMAADKKVLTGAFAQWMRLNFIDANALAAIEGLTQALFAMAVHKDDFPPDSYGTAVKLIAEALAMRLAKEPEGGEK
jgi:AcrR family transcriptional regulator